MTGTPLLSVLSPPPVLTVSEPVAVCVVAADVADTVNVDAPDAVADAVSVRVEVPPAMIVGGLNDPVTPLGRPLTESVID